MDKVHRPGDFVIRVHHRQNPLYSVSCRYWAYFCRLYCVGVQTLIPHSSASHTPVSWTDHTRIALSPRCGHIPATTQWIRLCRTANCCRRICIMFVDMQSPKLCKSQSPVSSLDSLAERIIFFLLTAVTNFTLVSLPFVASSWGNPFSSFFLFKVLACDVCLWGRDWFWGYLNKIC
jgi:hypothetical protein